MKNRLGGKEQEVKLRKLEHEENRKKKNRKQRLGSKDQEVKNMNNRLATKEQEIKLRK